LSITQFKEEARSMVSQMVEMERSYLTAEVFREILSSSHATDELSEDAGVRVSSLDGVACALWSWLNVVSHATGCDIALESRWRLPLT
jgi:hypothetical protein